MEILSMDRALLGLCYNRGSGTLKNGKEVIFHEIGIGLFILQIHFTFY
jgi:hypothetical protein